MSGAGYAAPLPRRVALSRLGALLMAPPLASLIAGCTPLSTLPGAPPTAAPSAGLPALLADLQRALRAPVPAVLALGETHDNAEQHRLRLGWLSTLLARGERFCLAMEQFDLPAQSLIDAARASPAGHDARSLATAAGFRFDGWQWPLYEPVVALALRHHLPLIAVNLPGAETSRIARGQPHALAQVQPGDWRAADEAAQRREIADGHCGVLPDAALPAMARAQRARDAAMAQAVVAAIAQHRLPVVLLAGNGHVRHDLGVPRYLAGAGHRGRVLAVGLIERSSAATPGISSATSSAEISAERDPLGHYDWQVLSAAQPRPDPCEGLRRRFSSGGGALLDRTRPASQ